ncbi:cupin domain-containing protein [Myxococcota bacterium]|nr:cupin domain-containing protein [Myxococcota bacterium]
MAITVHHNHFRTDDSAESEIAEAGLHCSHQTYEATGGNPIHWHPLDIHGYIKSGTFRFRDVSTGEEHTCRPGSYFHIPMGALHTEEAHEGYDVILGLSVPFAEIPQPASRPPQALRE